MPIPYLKGEIAGVRLGQVTIKEGSHGKNAGPELGIAELEDEHGETFFLVVGEHGERRDSFDTKEEAEAALAAMTAGETRYGSYTLPGGENYRGPLLTLPPDVRRDRRN